MPGLDSLAAKYAGKVSVLGVVGWGSPRQAAAFAQEQRLSHLPLVAGAGAFVEAMGVESVPTTFFVQADGTVTGRLVGLGPRWLFDRQARKLLDQAQPASATR